MRRRRGYHVGIRSVVGLYQKRMTPRLETQRSRYQNYLRVTQYLVKYEVQYLDIVKTYQAVAKILHLLQVFSAELQ